MNDVCTGAFDEIFNSKRSFVGMFVPKILKRIGFAKFIVFLNKFVQKNNQENQSGPNDGH